MSDLGVGFLKQKFMQSNLVRVEEMRMRRRDVEQWMSHRMLPDNLRERIRRHEQYKWQETKGVEEDSLIQSLPRDLRRDLKRHLCWSLLKRVSTFVQLHPAFFYLVIKECCSLHFIYMIDV